MKPLVVIPARGGSKGIPGKNIKKLNGKPLIYYTLDAAMAVFPPSQICVSTDSVEIKATVEEYGIEVPFIRPSELSTDQANSSDVLLHALNYYEEKGYIPDLIVFLQATSPFRNSSHIEKAMQLFDEHCEMVVSVKETAANPYYVLFEEDEEGYLVKSKSGKYTRRQDCPKVWEYNGAIYLINPKALKKKPLLEFTKVKKYVMDEINSLDIDTPLDWKIAEVIAKELDL